MASARRLPALLFAAVSAIAIAEAVVLIHDKRIVRNAPPPGIFTNEAFITGFRRDINTADPISVFRYVFANLPYRPVVYPTENHYYFWFTSARGIVHGNLSLEARDRDSGVLTFSYFLAAPEDALSVELNRNQGVRVGRIDDFHYSVTFESRTVVFELNQVSLRPPLKARLRSGEVFVGPSFDESGLRFYLLFYPRPAHFLWILNEDVSVPEQFETYSADVLIGRRTRFAFYIDRKLDRKILIGASLANVRRNTWYDGPFDQLPDNYVRSGQVELRKYMEAAHPSVRGQIDPWGYYMLLSDSRFPIAPYHVYQRVEELNFVEDCRRKNPSDAEFYACLTKGVYGAASRALPCCEPDPER